MNFILVTGASRGLGLAIAKDLAEHGFSIVLNGRDKSPLQSALRELNPKVQHFEFCCDLVNENGVEKLSDFLTQNEVKLDGVVHNLGGKVANDIQPLQSNTLHASMRLNLEVAIELNNYLIPSFVKRCGGTIVHIGSSCAANGNAAPAYAISKGALHTYVKNSARYYAKDGVCICAVVPGILDHAGSEWDHKAKYEPEKYAKRKAAMPLGRFAKPEEIAPFVSSIFVNKSIQAAGTILYLEGGE